jgi:hypothetical protein
MTASDVQRQRREQVARLIVEGYDRQTISNLTGLSVSTVSRWRKDKYVVQYMAALQSRSASDPDAGAIARLRKLVASDDESVALKACELLLRFEVERVPKPPAEEREIAVPPGHRLVAIIPEKRR